MHDYGFKPGTLFGLASEDGFIPQEADVYDPRKTNRGNSNFGSSDETIAKKLDMLTPRESGIDVRLFFTGRDAEEWGSCRWPADADVPHFYKYSGVSDN